MKAIFKYIFACLALVVGMTACEKDAELPWPGDPDGAEKQVIGTYTGSWTRYNYTTEVTDTDNGTVTFTYDEELGNNVATVSFTNSDPKNFNLGLKAEQCNCNVTKRANGTIIFWNAVATNPFGMKFTGEIDTEGNLTMTYHNTVRYNRKETEFDYTFSGAKGN